MPEQDDVPLLLQEMRVVWQKLEPQTPGESHCKDWLADDPKGFRAHMVKLESELAQGKVVRTEEMWDGKGECPVCKRGALVVGPDKVEDTIAELLRKV